MRSNLHTPISLATAVMSFAIGAGLTWAVAEAMRRRRMSGGPMSDDIVLERVRARVAQVVARPEAVVISVENGVVRLAGEVAPQERDQLLSQLLWLPGVVRLRNALGTS